MEMTDLGGLFELGTEDFGFMIPPWTVMESLDEIIPVSFEANLCNDSSNRQGFELKRPAEMLHFGSEKPPKIPKSEKRWNSADFGTVSSVPKQVALSPNSVINFPSEFSISQDSETCYHLSSSQAKRVSLSTNTNTNTRTPHAQGHVMAERKRREKLGQRFIAMSALIPGLKKMDKTSVLTDAIKYLKQLQERVKTLETEVQKKKSMESVVLVKKKKYEDDDRISMTAGEDTLPEIEVRRCSENVLIRIHCEKKKGIMEKVIAEIQKFHLSFVNSNVLTFGGGSTLDITILTTMDEEFSATIQDLVSSIRRIL